MQILKHVKFLLILTVMLGTAAPCLGGSFLNPDFSAGQFKLFGYLDLCTGREFEYDWAHGNYSYEPEYHRGFFRAQYGINDRIAIFGELGMAQITDVGTPYGDYDSDFDIGPALGGGVHVNVYEIESIDSTVRAAGRFMWFTNSGDSSGRTQFSHDSYEEWKSEYDLTWLEIQGAGIFDYAGVPGLNAYGGILLNAYGEIEVEWDDTSTYAYNGYRETTKDSGSDSADVDSIIGIFGGAAYAFNDAWAICGELHLLDETCFTISGIFTL